MQKTAKQKYLVLMIPHNNAAEQEEGHGKS